MEPNEKDLDEIEELDSIRRDDEAKVSREESIPFEQAIREIESCRG